MTSHRFIGIGIRFIIILAIILAGWQLIYHRPAQRLHGNLQKASDTLDNLSDNSDLLVPLNDMDLHNLKLHDKASAESQYREAAAAAAAASQKESRCGQNLTEKTYWPSQRGEAAALKQAQASISSFCPALKTAQNVFNYYSASSLALVNLWYYDPATDTIAYQNSRNPDELTQRFGQAQQGLKKIATRLNKLPAFNDPNLKNFIPQINSLANSAGQISSEAAVDPRQAATLADSFGNQINNLQQQLLNDRQSFWKNNQTRLQLLDEINKIGTNAKTAQRRLKISTQLG